MHEIFNVRLVFVLFVKMENKMMLKIYEIYFLKGSLKVCLKCFKLLKNLLDNLLVCKYCIRFLKILFTVEILRKIFQSSYM